MEVIFAFFYAAIVALSYKRAGIFPALFWPVTVVIAGIMVYATVALGPMPEDTDQ
jgi:hypothetical protein